MTLPQIGVTAVAGCHRPRLASQRLLGFEPLPAVFILHPVADHRDLAGDTVDRAIFTELACGQEDRSIECERRQESHRRFPLRFPIYAADSTDLLEVPVPYKPICAIKRAEPLNFCS